MFVLDAVFVATLYTSDSGIIMRYTDEGEITELCKWTVDLSSLPSFRNNAATQPGGFYTGKFIPILSMRIHLTNFIVYSEFELGLELDSAEVRGILLYKNQEWGRWVLDVVAPLSVSVNLIRFYCRVTFDFLN